jgi:carbohydrate-binding DOMON domain-containing protein
MKNIKIFIVVLLTLGLASCAGFGQWKPEAQTALKSWSTWANEWVGGVIQNAPAIIAAVATRTGNTKEIKAANAAVTALQAALGAYHAVTSTTSQEGIIEAIAEVNATIGAIENTAAILGVKLPSSQ